MKKQTFISTCLLISGTITSPVTVAGVLDGKDINVKWEVWEDTPGNGGALLALIEETNVVASDQATPDVSDFHSVVDLNGTKTTYELWDVNFNGETIGLTYTSREVGDMDHQYMYSGPEGFHFEDTKGNLPDITGVTVDSNYAPHGFEPTLVTFDANNIYVDLDGSMCHMSGMASMPDCANANSPTGFDNQIKLMVKFGDGSSSNDNARIDALFDFAEKIYPQYFPSHEKSADVMGYYARYYPESNMYIGTKGGVLFAYGAQLGGLYTAGGLGQWFSTAGL